MTEREPTEEELRDLLFAWKAVKHVKSNAIVLVKDSMILGMGEGGNEGIQIGNFSFSPRHSKS